MKKVLAMLLAVVLFGFAGTEIAEARGRGGQRGGQSRNWSDKNWNNRDWNNRNRNDCPIGWHQGAGSKGMRGQGRLIWQNVPDDIRSKSTERAKLRLELHETMGRRPVDRAKALELRNQMRKLSQELSDWRFNQRLDFIEKIQAPTPTK